LYGSVSTLLIPFITICILAVLVDRFTLVLEEIMRRIPKVPNKFWGPVAYTIVFAAGFIVCWRGNFDFFTYLNFSFHHSWEGWGMTALLLSGGSKFVRQSFGLINSMPQAVSGVCSVIGGMLGGGNSQDTPADTTVNPATSPESNESGE